MQEPVFGSMPCWKTEARLHDPSSSKRNKSRRLKRPKQLQAWVQNEAARKKKLLQRTVVKRKPPAKKRKTAAWRPIGVKQTQRPIGSRKAASSPSGAKWYKLNRRDGRRLCALVPIDSGMKRAFPSAGTVLPVRNDPVGEPTDRNSIPNHRDTIPRSQGDSKYHTD